MAEGELNKSIGIRLFDDKFVPIIHSDLKESKKIVLTTIEDNQRVAMIELYEGIAELCKDNEFLGKLIIENIELSPKGSPAIEVILRLGEDDKLYVKAQDVNTGEEKEMTIEHKVPEKIYQETLTNEKLTQITEKEPTGTYSAPTMIAKHDTRKIKSTTYFLVALMVIIALIFVGILFFQSGSNKNDKIAKTEKNEQIKMENESVKLESLDNTNTVPAIDEIQEEKPEETDIPQTVVEQPETTETVAEETVQAEETLQYEETSQTEETEEFSGDVIKYRVKSGDNLWDLSKSYFGDPWLYPEIYKANPQLERPSLIYYGTYINIPKKNN